ncbi:hypothetical protein PIB30_056839 [Stylosanthes scabra]|uniref:BHLH domain-containing protein n=1 Tax=Stylosanthes scabra TaxID=79078 RepID=A0ABU6YK38_9FABA|nr:hypothetical protein [Stylosanthes scabra]
MALSTYLNWDTLQNSMISEFCNTNFHELTAPEEYAADHYYHQYNDESFLFPNNFFLDPYFDLNTGFLHPDIFSSHQPQPSCTPSYDPFITLNGLFQTESFNFNTLPPCSKRQKYFHEEQELEHPPPLDQLTPPNFVDGFISNSSTLLSSEEVALAEELLLPTTTPAKEFMVSELAQGDFCVGVNVESEKKCSERIISAQSIAARERRRKITEKTQELGKLVPGGPKMNTAEMLHAAFKYVKYLQTQASMLQLVNTLQEDEVAPPSEDLCTLVASPFVQEKLYSEELCIVPKEFVSTLTSQRDIRTKPTIVKDLEQLIETNNV